METRAQIILKKNSNILPHIYNIYRYMTRIPSLILAYENKIILNFILKAILSFRYINAKIIA